MVMVMGASDIQNKIVLCHYAKVQYYSLFRGITNFLDQRIF